MNHPNLLRDEIFKILPNVRKPARYIGNELNSIHKNWDSSALKIALGYPDLYEIGMSNLGIQILYHLLNAQKDVLCERFFSPFVDMEQFLTEKDLDFFSIESFRALREFDLIGFSVGYELTYTNIINILHLSKIPIYSKDRNDSHPLVFAGGPVVVNPAPIEDFIDFFVIGEGEDVLLEIVEVLKSTPNKEKRLDELAKLEGVYIPKLGNRTKKCHVKDLDNAYFPAKPIVPFIATIHDRAVVEIMRGCERGCKFCSAFSCYKPVRMRSPNKVIELAEEIIKNTGYEELSLVSLSSSDYPYIEEVINQLTKKFESQKINIALPSLRLDSLTVKLIKEMQKVRKSSVTVAPEAGSQRLRDFIRKDLTEEQILEGICLAASAGISNIKLYYMIGLPTETEEDLVAIVELTRKIYLKLKEYSKRAHVVVSISTFTPKAHTPFERERQIHINEILEKQQFLKKNMLLKHIEIRWHDAKTSIVEGVLGRGDNRMSSVIYKAWELGARFDAWSEHFKFDVWEDAFKLNSLTFEEYLIERKPEEILPWNKIVL